MRQKSDAGQVDMVEIPEESLHCAIFLRVGAVGQHRVPKATAFLVTASIEGLASPATPAQTAYFVTARHCLHEARAEGHDTIYLRLNLSDGSPFEEIPTRMEDWYESDKTDVALIPFVPPLLVPKREFEEFAVVGYDLDQSVGAGPEYQYVGPTALGDMKIRPNVGTEVYLTGLFTEHFGSERNLPVARFGHIARMPSSITLTNPDGSTYEAVAYLAEFQSWGGVSGSPVYFLEPRTVINVVVDDSGIETPTGGSDYAWVTALMGIVSGHYDIEKKGTAKGEIGSVTTALNSGIAVVLPIESLRELLNRADIVKQRASVGEWVKQQARSR